MEDYSRAKHVEAGYEFVNTPHITKGKLYEISGHLDWYSDGMFPPMHLDAELGPDGEVRKPGQDYYLKPMNCPMHILIYKARGRSYRELPLRMFEFGTVYRYEKSGVIHGLTRVRGMTQDDAHIFTTIENMRDELRKLLTFVLDLLRDYGLDDFYLELSTKNPDKYVGDDEALGDRDRDAGRGGRGVGPRARPRPGRRCVLRPEDLGAGARRHRPHLADVDDPARLQPARAVRARVPRRRRRAAPSGDDPPRAVRLDRAVLRRADRALRRCVPGLARAGAGRRHPGQRGVRRTTCRAWSATLARAAASGSRSTPADDRMQKKIRNAQKQKVPFMLIAGADDVAAGAVSFRYRNGTQKNGVPIADAVEEIVAVIEQRLVEPDALNRSSTADAPDLEAEVAGDVESVPGSRSRTASPFLTALQRLWTPHRMAYISGDAKPGPEASARSAGSPRCRTTRD